MLLFTVLTLGIGGPGSALSQDDGDRPPQPLPIEILFERPKAGDSGDLVLMPNGDLLAVNVFARTFVRFDASGRLIWERTHEGGQPRHTVAVPGGGFVSAGVKKVSPVSLFPPGVAIKGNFDIWIGRFDDGGDLLWEKTFGDLQLEMGQAVTAFEDGTLALTGFVRSRETWLLRLSANGLVRWEGKLGGGRSAILSLDDGDLAVVSQVPEYQEGTVCVSAYDVTPIKVWRFSRYGMLSDVVTARDDTVGSQTGCNWNCSVARDPKADAGIFVLSSWIGYPVGFPMPALIEIAKVDFGRGVLWSQSVQHSRDEVEYQGCYNALTVLSNGSPVVACSNRNGIDLHVFRSDDSRGVRYRVNAPDCDHKAEVAAQLRSKVYLAAFPDGRLALAGAARRRDGECSWLARLSLPDAAWN